MALVLLITSKAVRKEQTKLSSFWRSSREKWQAQEIIGSHLKEKDRHQLGGGGETERIKLLKTADCRLRAPRTYTATTCSARRLGTFSRASCCVERTGSKYHFLRLDRVHEKETQHGKLSLLRGSLRPRVLGIKILYATFY